MVRNGEEIDPKVRKVWCDMKKNLLCAVAVFVIAGLCAGAVQAGSREVRKVESCIEILSEIMEIPEQGMPPALLNDAWGVAIIPNLIKAGFIFGGRYGTGVLVVHSEDHGWSNPVFVSLAGGSFGWQIGAQAIDVILVFKTKRSLDAITSGKFTLGADASVAAGPVGRYAGAATDIQLKAEIYSYSRTRGLFAGIALDGAVLQIDYKANSAFYDMAGLLPLQILTSKEIQAPPVAEDLKKTLTRYASQPGG